MKRLATILLLISLVTGCASATSDIPSETTTTGANTTVESNMEEVTAENTVELPSETVEEFPSESLYITETDTVNTEQMEISQLFKTVYLPYANREQSFIFDAVKSFALSTEYDAEITEPTSEDFGEIKLTDENGDYVYFGFNPINNVETIMIVSYYQASTNSEVSLSNFSSDGSRQYDTYDTHVLGESSVEVSGPDEQQRFLFN